MVFSSLVFLFCFLPITLLLYYLLPFRVKNYWLLFCSLVFFAWGGVSYTLIILISIIVNYFLGLILELKRDSPYGYYWLLAGVFINLSALAIFKYADFTVNNLNLLLEKWKIQPLTAPDILLPVGISFYTFHALSYLIDIYRKKSDAQHNLFDLALYICMFSQLIAGPIIRYSDVWTQLRNRHHHLSFFVSGIKRFLAGLGKKVILANSFALAADTVFNGSLNHLSYATAWLGLLCYTLQIYYDFSGYSDMAIGLGRMFGFNFMENFNFPYTAQSIKEFWRRWHISLSSFFKDYVYIPLGGNRYPGMKTYRNLIIVFFLTGFWHGASWTFVVWGLFHGLFIVLERSGLDRLLHKSGRITASLYTLLVVMMAWVLFRVNTLHDALLYWKALFSFKLTSKDWLVFTNHIDTELITLLSIGLTGALGGFKSLHYWFTKKVIRYSWIKTLLNIVSILFYITILLLCILHLTAGTYNPFIYYRF